jgi:hypothetical protein
MIASYATLKKFQKRKSLDTIDAISSLKVCLFAEIFINFFWWCGLSALLAVVVGRQRRRRRSDEGGEVSNM